MSACWLLVTLISNITLQDWNLVWFKFLDWQNDVILFDCGLQRDSQGGKGDSSETFWWREGQELLTHNGQGASNHSWKVSRSYRLAMSSHRSEQKRMKHSQMRHKAHLRQAQLPSVYCHVREWTMCKWEGWVSKVGRIGKRWLIGDCLIALPIYMLGVRGWKSFVTGRARWRVRIQEVKAQLGAVAP